MTDLPKMAHDRCVAQIAESLFGQPGMTLMEMAERREEIEALAKDAGRYRWLQKQTPYRFGKIQAACVIDAVDTLYFKADEFDAQIDAEMENGNV